MVESSNLKNAAAKGLFWSAVERFGSNFEKNSIAVFISCGHLKCVFRESNLSDQTFLKCK
jgi:hypothetical protein